MLLVSVSLAAEAPSSTNSYLTSADKARFKKILDSGLKFEDLLNTHYAVVGYKQLNEQVKLIGVNIPCNRLFII